MIITHLHVDHASAVSEFPQATFVIDRREWEAAADGGARRAITSASSTTPSSGARSTMTARRSSRSPGFGRTLDLFGDGAVRLVSSPGHTPGHQSVLLRTGHGEVLIAGDTAYTEE